MHTHDVAVIGLGAMGSAAAVAQLTTGTQPRLDLSPFRVDRFATVGAAQGRGA